MENARTGWRLLSGGDLRLWKTVYVPLPCGDHKDFEPCDCEGRSVTEVDLGIPGAPALLCDLCLERLEEALTEHGGPAGWREQYEALVLKASGPERERAAPAGGALTLEGLWARAQHIESETAIAAAECVPQ